MNRSNLLHRVTGVAALGLVAVVLSGCVVAPVGPYRARGYGYDEAVVGVAPPPLQAEVVGVAPYPGAIWIGGYWGWSGGRHLWVNGRWDSPRPGYRWAPHRWEQGNGGWRQHPGHWERG